MRVSLNEKEHAYFKRTDLSGDTTPVLIQKLSTSGPMTRRVVLSELARREGALVVKARK